VLLPVEAQPLDGLDDGVDVFLLFLGRVGVVEAQVAGAAVDLGQAEVEADALGVAVVQVAVGLGREAGLDAAAPLAEAAIFVDEVADEVAAASAGEVGAVIWVLPWRAGADCRRIQNEAVIVADAPAAGLPAAFRGFWAGGGCASSPDTSDRPCRSR
jgi:hypothetical protein